MSSPSSPAYTSLPPQKELFIAAGQGNIWLIRVALAKGADLEATDKRGRTALIEACRKRRRFAVEYLLGCGADPNYARGRSIAVPTAAHDAPIQVAIDQRDEETALLLLEAGANPATVTHRGLTLLHLSKSAELLELAARLETLGVSEKSEQMPWREGWHGYRLLTGQRLDHEAHTLRVNYLHLTDPVPRRTTYAPAPASTLPQPPQPPKRLLWLRPVPPPSTLWERFKATMGWGRNS